MAWKHRTVEQEWQIVALSKSHTQREISKLLDIGQSVVHDVQRKYHITHSFGRHHAARNRYRYDEHSWGLLIEHFYYSKGFTLAQTARAMGVDIGTIRRRMRELGIPWRSSGESQRGRKRKPYRRGGSPECEEPGCTTEVRSKGQTYCHRHR